MEKIDCRGLTCPAPVLRTREAVARSRPASLEVTVDNDAARENVSRFLGSQGYAVSIIDEKAGFRVLGTRSTQADPTSCDTDLSRGSPGKTLILISSNRMGHGDDELGSGLMVSFLKTIGEMGSELWRLIFVNSGVKLTIEGSEVLSVLKGYEREGLQILVCGTCLNHFKLLDKKEVGDTTNMLDIVTALQLADKVINL